MRVNGSQPSDWLLTLLTILLLLIMFVIMPLQAAGVSFFQGFGLVTLLAIIAGAMVISINPMALVVMSAAGRLTRFMLGRKSRRNWRRNQTRNPPWPCRQTVPETGTPSLAAGLSLGRRHRPISRAFRGPSLSHLHVSRTPDGIQRQFLALGGAQASALVGCVRPVATEPGGALSLAPACRASAWADVGFA